MNNNFANNLKKIRKENNLSQEELAEYLGVSRQAISKWESKVAYPEMDKIIALCDKFNLNIDDLLHKDIKEVKNEEDAKRNLNNHLDEFLNFITDTINLFFSMNFKSKMKCLFEQIIIFLFILGIDFLIYYLFSELFVGLFNFLPYSLFRIRYVMEYCLLLALIIFSIIIFVKVFKSRYLDYYHKIKKEVNIKKEEDLNTNINKNDVKIDLKEKEDKIIIRDPKNSEYHFIKGLLKVVVGIIKFFSLFVVAFLSFSLVLLLCAFILSFLLFKTGLFFIGLLGITISLGVINFVILLFVINFIFNRLNNKKQMIWSFLISLITLGLSLGLLFIGSLDFNVVKMPSDTFIEKEITFEMKDKLFFDSSYYIEYVESDIDNVVVKYSTYKYCALDYNNFGRDGIYLWNSCNNYAKLIKDYASKLNNRIIMNLDTDIEKITIYASKENIARLKNNLEIYVGIDGVYEDIIGSYENEINNLRNRLEYYRNILDNEGISY